MPFHNPGLQVMPGPSLMVQLVPLVLLVLPPVLHKLRFFAKTRF